MKLYSYWRSSSSYRVRIALELKGAAYDYVAVDISPAASAQLAPAYGAVHPSRQVPVLELDAAEGGTRIGQSVAIVEYLDERFREPRLYPADGLARAYVREAVEVANSGMQPLHNLAVLNAVKGLAPEARANGWVARWLPAGLAALEAFARQRGGRFSVGDTLSAADVFLVPQLYAARRFDTDLEPYSSLLAIEQRCLALDAFRRAHPDQQPDAPPRAPREQTESPPR
jgi:maleylpyruvate isomerase